MFNVGTRIKERRKELNLSAEDIANKIGVSPATIYRYESGDIMDIKISKLTPIANALYTSEAYLMGWTEDPLAKSCPASSDLTPDEENLLSLYRRLNKQGQHNLMEQAEFFAGKDVYKKSGGSQLLE